YAQAMVAHQVIERAVAMGDLSRGGIINAINTIDLLQLGGLADDVAFGRPEQRRAPRASAVLGVDRDAPWGLRVLAEPQRSAATVPVSSDLATPWATRGPPGPGGRRRPRAPGEQGVEGRDVQAGEGREHRVRSVEVERGRHRARYGDDRHARGTGGGDAVRGVLEHDARPRGNTQAVGGVEEEVGRRFGAPGIAAHVVTGG